MEKPTFLEVLRHLNHMEKNDFSEESANKLFEMMRRADYMTLSYIQGVIIGLLLLKMTMKLKENISNLSNLP